MFDDQEDQCPVKSKETHDVNDIDRYFFEVRLICSTDRERNEEFNPGTRQ